MPKPFDVVEHLGHFNGIIPSLAGILKNQHGVRIGKFLLSTPGNAISETLNFKNNVPRCLNPQELVPLVRVPNPPSIHYQPAT